jgi:CDP-glycerol glycerophosphotransferase
MTRTTVRQHGETVNLRLHGTRPDAVVASAPDGTDIELPSRDGEWLIELSRFARTGQTWRVRARKGAVWLEWPQALEGDPLEPWVEGGAWALVTLEGGARPALVIATSATTGQLEVLAPRVRASRSGLTLEATALLGPHGGARIRAVWEDDKHRVVANSSQAPASATGPWRAVRLQATVPWTELAGGRSWTASVMAEFAHGEVTRRVAMPTTWRAPNVRRVRMGERQVFFEPRASYKLRHLGVRVEALSLETWSVLRRRAGARERSSAPLWLIGELPDRAQDNGLALFRHVRAHHPEIDARYVITADSPDRQKVEALGPVLLHGSTDHARAVLAADRIASSHHPDYLFPLRTPWMRRRVKATRVFLQHGVLAAKWVADIYGARAASFETDLFLVSSPRERDAVVRDFGYAPERVKVTGLPRFDALLAESGTRELVLVVPTWRPWITAGTELADSDFLAQWRSLLGDPRLVEALTGRETVVVAHPNMAALATEGLEGTRAVKRGEDLQSLIRRAAIVVTDYSSMAVDAALLGKPVVYFPFDRNRLQGRTGGHSSELPGREALTVDAAVEAIVDAAAGGFQAGEAQSRIASSFFPAGDTGSAERVVAAIAGASHSRPGRLRTRLAAARRRAWSRAARSRARVAVVRTVYEGARLLPLRSGAVLFECSFGRQYGDSPRAIFEELRSSRPNLTCTWVGVRAPDAATVGRMTPRYAWELATAGTLVANQSFPHWARTRRSQVCLQTWHGTPLKRMLHDLPHITGRDAGNVTRASKGAAQWTVLVSPNAHTTAAMASAFRHRARVLEVGYPRNDVFFRPDAAERAARTRATLGIAQGKAMVLHAPTFRDEGLGGAGVYVPTEAIDMARFAERFGDRAVLVLRRHILDRTPARIPPVAAHCVVDATGVDDAQDLLLAADVLVTDYSSVAFDFLNTRRPSVFLAPDIDSYRDDVRGFYLDPTTELPGPVVRTQDEFFAALSEALDTGAVAGFDLEALASRYCPHGDGHAAARVVAEVFTVG